MQARQAGTLKTLLQYNVEMTIGYLYRKQLGTYAVAYKVIQEL